jgi:SOS-response transcriptional repressor LexA
MHYFFDEDLSRLERIQRTEEEIYQIIDSFIKKQNRPPTTREIVKLSRVNSTSTVNAYLKKLKKKGYVNWVEGRPGTLKIINLESTALN